MSLEAWGAQPSPLVLVGTPPLPASPSSPRCPPWWENKGYLDSVEVGVLNGRSDQEVEDKGLVTLHIKDLLGLRGELGAKLQVF
jgi:hypothetical protein